MIIVREYSNGAKLEVDTQTELYIKAWRISLGFGMDAPSMQIVCARHEEATIPTLGTELNFKLVLSDKTSVLFKGYVYKISLNEDFVYDLLLRSKDYFTSSSEDYFDSITSALSKWETIDSNAKPVSSGTLNMFKESPYQFVNRIAPCYNKSVVYGRGLNRMVFRQTDGAADFNLDYNSWIIEGGTIHEVNKHDTKITPTRGDWSAYSLGSGCSVLSSSAYKEMSEAAISNHKFDVASTALVLGTQELVDIAPGMLVDLTYMNYRKSTQMPTRGFVSMVDINAEGAGMELSIEVRGL